MRNQGSSLNSSTEESRFSGRKEGSRSSEKPYQTDRHTHTHADTTYFSSQREVSVSVSVSVVSPSPKVGVGHNCR